MSDEETKYEARCDVDGWKGSIRNSYEEASKDVDKHNRNNEGHNASVEVIYPNPKVPLLMDLPDLLKSTKQQFTLSDLLKREGFAPLIETVRFDFTMQRQEGDYWCWAAVAVSVSRFYNSGSTWTQCSLATAELTESSEDPVPKDTNCCNTPKTCDVIWYLTKPLRRTGNLNANWEQRRASWDKVKTEVRNNRPLCVHVSWNGGGAHFLAIVGFTEQDAGSSLPNTIDLRDSIWGNSTHNWNNFARTYHDGGTWDESYYTES